MAGVKRKDAPSDRTKEVKKQKTAIKEKPVKKSRLEVAAAADDFGGSSGDEAGDKDDAAAETKPLRDGKSSANGKSSKANQHETSSDGPQKKYKLETSSAEAHAKQRALAKERKLQKPNADSIQRAKKLWERLRRKSHVPADERKELVAELFTLIEGRVSDFVFKHDSVRVIQCALKYANQEQRKTIVRELKNDIRPLTESRYGKFLVAKMVVEGDQEVRDMVVPQFYGHVRRLINHPEASWIMDDIYRQVASKQQKATMLREWYGAEFALFQRKPDAKPAAVASLDDTAELAEILKQNPEKKRPILQYLQQMINSLVQKKMTGFTMLHDAMLQYFLALTPESEEHKEFLEILKGDIDAESEGGGGDVFKNLAFTKSGSRLVCLALAYGSAKDRKVILRVFKDNIETMAFDPHAKLVLVTGLETPDDTKMTTKAIMHEYLGQHITDEDERLDRLENIVTNVDARLPVLCPLAGLAKWLVKDNDKAILEESFAVRGSTSKKSPEQRHKELSEYISGPALELVAKRAESLVKSSFGCIFAGEVLLATSTDDKAAAKQAISQLAAGDPLADDHVAKNAFASRMLKTLVTGGNFDPKTKQVTLAEPRLGFAADLYPVIKDHLVDWACSDSSFVVVALLEGEDVPDSIKADARKILSKGKKRISAAAKGEGKDTTNGVDGDAKKKKGNAGSKIVLENL